MATGTGAGAEILSGHPQGFVSAPAEHLGRRVTGGALSISLLSAVEIVCNGIAVSGHAKVHGVSLFNP